MPNRAWEDALLLISGGSIASRLRLHDSRARSGTLLTLHNPRLRRWLGSLVFKILFAEGEHPVLDTGTIKRLGFPMGEGGDEAKV